MNPSRFFGVLRDKWVVVGISTLLGLLVGVLLTLLTPTTFKSSTSSFSPRQGGVHRPLWQCRFEPFPR